jgi:hypothetical protein
MNRNLCYLEEKKEEHKLSEENYEENSKNSVLDFLFAAQPYFFI